MHYAEKRENEQHHVVLKRSLFVIIIPDPKSEVNQMLIVFSSELSTFQKHNVIMIMSVMLTQSTFCGFSFYLHLNKCFT